MLTAACPACGAPVLFRGATSIVAVCAHCSSTLVRNGAKVEDIGRAAQVIEDHSPLQVGVLGRWRNVGFLVAGRIQYRYGAGAWSEWHLVFDNGRSGWLSDDMGTYVLEFLQPPLPPGAAPPRATLAPGTQVKIGDAFFTVAERSASEVIAVQGELPVRVTPGTAVHTVDLRDPQGRFATLDYGGDAAGEQPQAVFAGTAVTLADLQASGLREIDAAAAVRAAPEGRATAFDCPSCGAPLTRRIATTESVACGSCGAVVDVTDARYQVIARSEATLAQLAPRVPLGAEGELQGTRYAVVGVMRRVTWTGGGRHAWHEYLLHHPREGYRFLVDADTHWGIAKLTNNAPRVVQGSQPTAHYLGRTYKHYATYQAKVDAVVGEFFWRVRTDEVAEVASFVAPPNQLSRETTADEVVWSVEEYLTPRQVWTAFGLEGEPPPAHGVAPHQPPPMQASLWPLVKACLAFAVLAAVVHLAMGLSVDGRVLLRQDVRSPGKGEPFSVTSEPFQVPGTGPLGVRARFGLQNTWAGVDFDLVEVDSQQRYTFAGDVAYYSDGPGDDEAEGSPETELRIVDIPPGRYRLEIDVEGDPVRTQPVAGVVEIYRAPPHLANLVIAWAALALGPLIVVLRRVAFEKRRWADSDHAPDDDDD